MVAKKTAEQSASGRSRSTGATGDEVGRPTRAVARATAAKEAAAMRKPPAAGSAGAAQASSAQGRRGTAAKTTDARRTGAAQPPPERTAPGTPDPKEPAEERSARREPRTRGAGRSTGRKSTAKKTGAARAARQTGATTVVAKKTSETAATEKTAVPKARIAAVVDPADLPVRPGEDPWTPEEVAEARAELQSETERLRSEISSSEASLAGLMRDSGDGAGDDQADTGTKNITREHEMALTANAREMLTQTERALQRLDAGTYGLCENCGNPIGKARMRAFSRATLCVECKQKQERRY